MLPINVALIQVSPPDNFGWMSLGVSVDISKAAAESADVVIIQVNPCMPRVLGRSLIHVNSADYIVEFEEPLLAKQDMPEIETADSIARHISRLINDGATLQTSQGMTSLNTAMEIDLTSQVAADALPYNNFSGVNGMLDFIRGAAMVKKGKSIFMLTSTRDNGKSSRIVPFLKNTAVVVPRGDVQFVVTEYGAVNLFGKSIQERALALISIAHPHFRMDTKYLGYFFDGSEAWITVAKKRFIKAFAVKARSLAT